MSANKTTINRTARCPVRTTATCSARVRCNATADEAVAQPSAWPLSPLLAPSLHATSKVTQRRPTCSVTESSLHATVSSMWGKRTRSNNINSHRASKHRRNTPATTGAQPGDAASKRASSNTLQEYSTVRHWPTRCWLTTLHTGQHDHTVAAPACVVPAVQPTCLSRVIRVYK